MDEKGRQLSTKDLVGAGDDVRGRREEEIHNRAVTPAPHPATDPRRTDMAANAPQPPRPAPAPAAHPSPHLESRSALFPGDESQRLRDRWNDIQANFVDAPRQAVEHADELVAETMKRLAEVFAGERQGLERQWDRGDSVTTEDLRVALQRYRGFFDRLLSV